MLRPVRGSSGYTLSAPAPPPRCRQLAWTEKVFGLIGAG